MNIKDSTNYLDAFVVKAQPYMDKAFSAISKRIPKFSAGVWNTTGLATTTIANFRKLDAFVGTESQGFHSALGKVLVWTGILNIIRGPLSLFSNTKATWNAVKINSIGGITLGTIGMIQGALRSFQGLFIPILAISKFAGDFFKSCGNFLLPLTAGLGYLSAVIGYASTGFCMLRSSIKISSSVQLALKVKNAPNANDKLDCYLSQLDLNYDNIVSSILVVKKEDYRAIDHDLTDDELQALKNHPGYTPKNFWPCVREANRHKKHLALSLQRAIGAQGVRKIKEWKINRPKNVEEAVKELNALMEHRVTKSIFKNLILVTISLVALPIMFMASNPLISVPAMTIWTLVTLRQMAYTIRSWKKALNASAMRFDRIFLVGFTGFLSLLTLLSIHLFPVGIFGIAGIAVMSLIVVAILGYSIHKLKVPDHDPYALN